MQQKQDISQLFSESLNEMVRMAVQKELAKISGTPNSAPQQKEDVFLDAKKASYFLSISIHTIRSKCQKREISHYKKGGRLLFLKSELMDWVKNGKVKTNQEILREMNLDFDKKMKR